MFSGKRKGLWFLGIACLVLVFVSFSSPPFQALFSQAKPALSASPTPQQLPITAQAKIQDQVIQLEVARTIPEQAKGLMYRPELAPDRGMLFPYSPPQAVSFWMKNCLISLDLVFIRDQKVIGIQVKAPPCDTTPCPVYPSPGPVDYVLELAGGRAASLGLTVGDAVVIESIR